MAIFGLTKTLPNRTLQDYWMSVTYHHLDVAQTRLHRFVLHRHVAIRSMQVEVVDVSAARKRQAASTLLPTLAASSFPGYSQQAIKLAMILSWHSMYEFCVCVWV